MKNGIPTMKDVAQEAGVALATVSKYYSGGAVGELYRLKVEQAARKLGYEVNRYAKSAKNRTAPVVAVILPNLNNPFFPSLTSQIYNVLAERGARMQVYLTHADKAEEERVLRQVTQDHVSGIIGMIYSVEQIPENLPPLVTIDCYCIEGVPCIASDNYSGGKLAAHKLIELGCRNLAFLRTGSMARSEPDKRGDGFVAECRNNRIPCEICWQNDEDDLLPFAEFFRAHCHDGRLDIDGIGCSTDFLVWRILPLLRELGISVPGQVQIIGYDGYRPFGTEDYVCSTIVQPLDKIAQTAVDVLFSIGQGQTPSLVCLPVTYAAGGTTLG